MNTWKTLSQEISDAVNTAAPSIVQVHGHRRVTAGVVIADNLIATPAATHDDKIAVLAGDGQPLEGTVLGRAANLGLTIVRVEGLNRPALVAAGTGAGSTRRRDRTYVERRRHGGVRADRRRGGPLRTGRAARSIA
jgi:hypothetical protein